MKKIVYRFSNLYKGDMVNHHLLRRHLLLKNRQGSTITLTLKVHVLVFPNASVAIQVTVVVPGGKNEPDAGVQTAVTPGLIVGSGKLTNAPLLPGSLNTVMSSGQVIVGGSVSRTVVLSVAVLLSGLGSASVAVTVAVLVIVPGAVGAISISTVALAPFANVPKLHITTPPASEQLPWLGVAEIKITPAGSVSVRVTLVASNGPLFVTVTV